MKDSYIIRFWTGTSEYALVYETRIRRITNGVRAEIAKIGDLSAVTRDTSLLSEFLRVILTADGVDFTDAFCEDTDVVVTDFFMMYNGKTN